MKKKVLKVIITMLLFIIVISTSVIAYFLFADIKTKKPAYVEDTCNVEVKEFMDRQVFILSPKQIANTKRTILYLHGGSYIAEATQDHWDFLIKLVNDTGSTIVFPDYPLAPKHTYHDVFAMMEPLYEKVLEHVNTEDLIVMGDSAGGGMALALEEKIQEKEKMPNKTILISPWLDVRLNNKKINEVAKRDNILSKEALMIAGLAYAGDDGIDSYLVNPVDGALSHLKNITIFTGLDDILNPDVAILKDRAKEEGIEIEVKEYKDAKHIWLIEKNTDVEITKKAYQDLLEVVQN